MARARNIKPGFFTNEDLVELSFEVRLLFIGLWTLADKDGRLEDRPKKIKMEVFPADNVDIDAGLNALARMGFIRRYEADGLRCVEVLNWAKHQSPHHTEKASTLPAPLDNGESTVNPPKDLRGNPPDSLIPDSLIHTEANASGAVAPQEADPIWHTGLAYLQRKGIPTPQARKFLGKLKREAGDIDAAALLAQAEADDITDPIPWLTRSAVAARERARQRAGPNGQQLGKVAQGLMALDDFGGGGGLDQAGNFGGPQAADVLGLGADAGSGGNHLDRRRLAGGAH